MLRETLIAHLARHVETGGQDDAEILAQAIHLAIDAELTTEEVVSLVDELERLTGRQLHSVRFD